MDKDIFNKLLDLLRPAIQEARSDFISYGVCCVFITDEGDVKYIPFPEFLNTANFNKNKIQKNCRK